MDCTYISKGDDFLLKVQGDDLIYIKTLIEELKIVKEALRNDLFDIVSSKIKISKNHYFSLLEWLIQNGILTEDINSKDVEIINIGVLGVGENSSLEIEKKLNEFLDNSNYSFKYSKDVFNSNLILLFSPILNKELNYTILEEIYKSKIPHIYADLSLNSISVGPAIIPDIKMHCMKCFFKRRISNTKRPKQYLDFFNLDIESSYIENISNYSYFNTLVEVLSNEIYNLLKTEWEYGDIIGKSKTINFLSNEFNVSRILKTPDCDICNERYIVRPVNG